jgi:hypothetical protein
MAADPFTIRIFVPDGDPEGIRIIDRLNWTGLGIAFPRDQWPRVRQRNEFVKAGVYILVGYQTEDDLPTLYIGQGDGVRNRIESHFANKDFWNWGIAFVSHSASGGLNRAHITWLEYALIERATNAARSHLDNGNVPQEPALSEAERADTNGFLKEVLQILPLVGLRAFEMPRPVATPMAHMLAARELLTSDELDTIIVPAQKEGFERVFLKENAWWAIRISGGMLPLIKYIAAYQTNPVSAVTHFAPVARIEPFGEGEKYKLIFSEPAQPIGPIPFGNAPSGSMQGPRYTSLKRLRTAKTIADLTGRSG